MMVRALVSLGEVLLLLLMLGSGPQGLLSLAV